MRGGRRIAQVNYAEHKKVYEDRTRAAGLGRVHGLPHGYALEWSYVRDDLLGKRPPVMQRWTDAIAE